MLFRVTLNRGILSTDRMFGTYVDIVVLDRVMIKEGSTDSRITKKRVHMRKYGFELIGSRHSPTKSICRYGYIYHYIVDLDHEGKGNIFFVLRLLLADEIRQKKIERLMS